MVNLRANIVNIAYMLARGLKICELADINYFFVSLQQVSSNRNIVGARSMSICINEISKKSRASKISDNN